VYVNFSRTTAYAAGLGKPKSQWPALSAACGGLGALQHPQQQGNCRTVLFLICSNISALHHSIMFNIDIA
jgi:hypothetical protein